VSAVQEPASAAPARNGCGALPPGPGLPRVIQTAGFMFAGARFLEWSRRRYGGAVYLRTLFDDGFVMVFDPALVRQVFQGSSVALHAGEANALLGPIVGTRSVLLLDEAEHLRHRRLMLAPFHGERMRSYAEVIEAATDAELDRWPVGETFTLLESMQSLTLSVIVHAVFGYQAGAEADELSRRLRAMVEPLSHPRGLMLMAIVQRLRGGGGAGPAARFAERQAAVDELLYAEIARRREDPRLAQRDDVFSALLLARDEDGAGLSDREVRDELVTLLLAGHETTATALAWTFDLLLHTPAVRDRAYGADDGYLDAVIKESLRMRAVIPAVGRVVRGEPFVLGPYAVPVGMEINPSIRGIHRRADLYPEPEAFRPERFLGEDAPDTYTWLPFGGGTRRCLGASFALMEMRLVLARILARVGPRLRAGDPALEHVELRAITQAPRRGVRVILDPHAA
jgi:cytochrome P450 family 135